MLERARVKTTEGLQRIQWPLPGTLRRTKIVATAGPATDDPEVLIEMVRAGRRRGAPQRLARHARDLQRGASRLVREAARASRALRGHAARPRRPEDPHRGFREGPRPAGRGRPVRARHRARSQGGHVDRGGCRLQGSAARRGGRGHAAAVRRADRARRRARSTARASRRAVRVGGELSDRKGLNRQGGGISAPALSDKDREDIRFAAEERVDYVAVSFARDAADIEQARALLRDAGGDARVVAKIERHEAIENLAEHHRGLRRR